MDGHASHIILELISLTRDRGVILFCLPSHTTHALQPLDVGVYGPLESRWGKILKEDKIKTCSVCRQNQISWSLKGLWEESFEAKHLKAGFRKAASQQKLSLNPALHSSIFLTSVVTILNRSCH